MNIPGLSGNLWPVHLKPLPDELLSSWLVRLAHGHGLKVQTFCALVFGRDKSIWNRDIDKLAPDWLLVKLSEATGTPLSDVMATTLRSYEGIVYEHHQPNGHTRWILPLGIYHRIHRTPGLHFCHQCLMEDRVPYYRKQWRLAFITVCTKHGCDLLNTCPECNSAVTPYRSDMRLRQNHPVAMLNVHCWKCGFDLRSTYSKREANHQLLRSQEIMECALSQGHVDWAGNPSMYSLMFFDGLRALIAGLTSKQTRERLEGPLALTGWPRTGLEMATLQMRRSLLQLLATLLHDWPEKFVQLIHDNKLRYSDLKGDGAYRPFWYEDVIRREAFGGCAAISLEEANAIADAVERKFGRYAATRAREISGRDIGNHAPDRKRHRISDDVYEELLVCIDHQVAGTQDEKERACLIRDKIMFAVGRVLGLSEQSLASLTIGRLRELSPDVDELSFVNVAKTPAQARAWVEWYWLRVRPELHPAKGVNHIFTSNKTHSGIKHSTVSARFQMSVKRAVMHRAIPNYISLIKPLRWAA